jgi:hypothetical protein
MQEKENASASKNFIDDLVSKAKNKKSSKTEVLQLNLHLSSDEMKNLKKLVTFLKANNNSITIKSLCYQALKESGLFEDKQL